MEGGNVRGGWIFFFKINKRASTFIREMRVLGINYEESLFNFLHFSWLFCSFSIHNIFYGTPFNYKTQNRTKKIFLKIKQPKIVILPFSDIILIDNGSMAHWEFLSWFQSWLSCMPTGVKGVSKNPQKYFINKSVELFR